MGRSGWRKRRSATAGFTILEVLISLAILGLSLSVLLANYSMSVDATRVARRDMEVSAVAQSLLRRIGTDLPLKPGTQSGAGTGDIRWQVTIQPYGAATEAPALRILPLEIVVALQWEEEGHNRVFSLRTLRLAPKD